MDKNLTNSHVWFLGAWFAMSTTTLILTIVSIFYLSNTKIIQPVAQNFNLYTALPTSEIVSSESIGSSDARAKIVENFFAGYKAPLADFADEFISVADKYQLDFRLLPAIAMQESNGGKKQINNSNNPFGYGIYGSLVVKFPSFAEAIERVGRALREDYLDKGLTNPAQIMTKYTPPSLAKGGSWAIGVSSFMEELR